MRTLLLFTCSLLGATLSAQKVDWDKAPINPVPIKYKAEHFNLKGPIFSADKKVFNEQGLLIKDISYLRYENGLPTGKGSVEWETDAEGNVIRQTFESGRVDAYTYSNGLLVEESYEYDKKKGTKRYSYDEAGRLVRLERDDNGQTETTTYAYSVDGDSVTVTETTQSGTSAARRSFKTYKGGLLTASSTEGESIELNVEYTFDPYGNPTKWVYAQNNGVRDEFATRYQYYPELRKANQLSYGSIYEDRVTPVAVFRNGQIAEDITYSERADGSGYAIYDDFSNSYYLASAGSGLKPGERIDAKLLVKDADAIAFLKGKILQPLYRGTAIFKDSKNELLATQNGDILTYSRHNLLKLHTSMAFVLVPGAEVLRGQMLEQTRRYFAVHMFYSVSEFGELELFHNAGSIPDPASLRMGKMGESDLVLYVNDEPYYLLPGALAEPEPGLHLARYYGKKDTDSVEPLPEDFKLSFDYLSKGAKPAAPSPDQKDVVPGFSEQDVAALYNITAEDMNSRVSPYISRTDAPLNPVPYVGSLWDINLDGDVAYAYDKDNSYFFDENGHRIHPHQDVFTDEETARREKAVYRLFDNANKLLMHKAFYPGGWDTIYKYNPDGTVQATYIIEGGQVVDHYAYVYDKQRRLVETVTRRGGETTTETFTYREEDGQLHVTAKLKDPEGEIIRTYVYGNGRTVRFTEDSSNYHTDKTYQYMNDDSGNPYVRLDQDGKETDLPLYYHTDTWQLDRWHWINEERYGQYSPIVYVDDRQVTELYGAYNEQNPFPHGVFYEPIGQNYFIAENALLPATRQDPDARGKMKLKISSPAMLYLTPSGMFNFYVYGRAIGDLKQFRLGNNLLIYNNKNGHTYLITDFELGEEKFYAAEDLGSDVTTWFRTSKESDFYFIKNGERPTGLSNGGFYDNRDLLINKDGKPWGILDAADLNGPSGKIYKMTPLGQRSLPGEAPRPLKNGNVPIQKYGFGVPITLERERGKVRFYQKGQPIFEPESFEVGDTGNAFAFYGTSSYHLFKQAWGLADGQSLLEEKVIIDPLLVENTGSQTRVWWKGKLVPESEYKLFPCDNGSRFLTLSKFKEYYELKPTTAALNYQVGSVLGSSNALIQNTDGFTVLERGLPLSGEEVQLYPSDGNLLVYVGTDPVYILYDIGSPDELAPGIYPLSDFSY
ncbi:hypothetical protein H5P28_07630 [Ruficoccus amylovorans]|uniref:YD repeat-containing protein n=1 Tax=Ruficoccus amylovorans TaxID=1804625 RepID=A0A842HFS2_9BACT|nr:hypothetical protein [Ruficoccus amylovorans]MBC2594131.1 hypothetical protein [Ruficoccus amylovorans]